MVRLLSIAVLILSIILFPPASLALVSNNAVPGDKTYMIKRGLEDIVYAIASINLSSKAWFSAARSDRRYKEFTLLLKQGKFEQNTLDEFVVQTNTAVSQLSQISDANQKKDLLADLSNSISQYDQGLIQASEKIIQSSPKIESLRPVAQSSINPSLSTPNHEPISTPVPNNDQEQIERIKEQQRLIDKARADLEALQRQIEEEKRKSELFREKQNYDKQNTPSPSANPSIFTPTPSPSIKSSPKPKHSASPSSSPRSGREREEGRSGGGGDQFLASDSLNSFDTLTSIDGSYRVAVAGSNNSSCSQDCSACPAQNLTKCGLSNVYDTCIDNLGRYSGDTTFCGGGATGFKCYAQQNSNCISIDRSNPSNEFTYSCDLCVSSAIPTDYYTE